MPSIDELLAQAAAQKANQPLAANAQQLFFAGHLTAQEYQQVSATEQVAARIPDTAMIYPDATGLGKRDGDVFTLTEGNQHVAPFYNKSVKEARQRVDGALAALVPNQIEHVIIRTQRSDKTEVSAEKTTVTIEAVFQCINVKKRTDVKIATPIQIPISFLKLNEDNSEFWRMFDGMLIEQLSRVVLQLIQEIKTGRI